MRKMVVEQRRPYGWTPVEAEQWVYCVTSVDNATQPVLGTIMTPEQLIPFCDDEAWDVRIRWSREQIRKLKKIDNAVHLTVHPLLGAGG